MDQQTTVVEIHGVKLEVDLRTAKRIDTLRVGSRVKVLVKESYSKSCKVFAGVVIGFEPFKELPTIIVCYLDSEWSGVSLKWVTLNAQTENIEVVASIDDDSLSIERNDVLAKFDTEMAKKKNELQELRQKRAFFVEKFHEYFEPAVASA